MPFKIANLLTMNHSGYLMQTGIDETSEDSWQNYSDLLKNGLNSFSVNGTQDSDCDGFDGVKHMLMQVSNLFCVTAFLVPHKYHYGILGMRCLLSISFLLGCFWAGLIGCSPDSLAWYLLLFLINFGHSVYLIYKFCPPRIDPELMDLYLRVFMPVKVKKKHFKELVRDAEIQTLEVDEHYAMEGITVADQKLAILLSGKMKATCEELLLHYVLPTEFVDSPEWEACRKDCDKLFQVTLTASEHCRLLTWRRQSLETLLKSNRFLDMIIYNLVGKDITHKLYSLNEHHKPDDAKSAILGSHPEMWRTQMSKSLSVDAVHTGKQGKLRSAIWRETDRRGSETQSNSIVGSSPDGMTRHGLHSSDPGPTKNPAKQSTKPEVDINIH